MVGIESEQERTGEGAAISRHLLEALFISEYQPQMATLRLFPPYVISMEEMDRFLEAFEWAIQEMASVLA